MAVVTDEPGGGLYAVGVIRIGDRQGACGDQVAFFGDTVAGIAADRRYIIGTGDDDGDGLVIRGGAVGDADGEGQHQALGLVEVIEGLGSGVKAPVKGIGGLGIGEITSYTHHREQGAIGDAGDVTALGDAEHGRADGVGGIDVGQGQGAGNRQRAIGLGQGLGRTAAANRDHRIVVCTGNGDGDGLCDTGGVTGSGIIGGGIVKGDVTGLAIGEVLEVGTRIEGEGAIVVVEHAAFGRCRGDGKGMGVIGIGVGYGEVAVDGGTIFGRGDGDNTHHGLIVGAGKGDSNSVACCGA